MGLLKVNYDNESAQRNMALRSSKDVDYQRFNVPIPLALKEKLLKISKEHGFRNVSDYVAFILREAIAKQESEKPEVSSTNEKTQIKERLKRLGYI